MEKLNINDYKVIVLENGQIVFKAIKSDGVTHGDCLRDYCDLKIIENKYNNNLLTQVKRVDALDYMVDNIIIVTNSQVILNANYCLFVLLSNRITKEEIENLKQYSDMFNEFDSIVFEKVFIQDNMASDEIIMLDDYTKSLPFDQQLDVVYDCLNKGNELKKRV